MAITMKKILERFNDCDMFSLTGSISGKISEEDLTNAIKKIEDKNANNQCGIYNETLKEIKNKYSSLKKLYVDNNQKRNIILEHVPDELKKHFLYYEISFYNSVTIGSDPMINYYFKLNEETKEYLLKFRNDFCLNNSGLEDLTIYKDKQEMFSSCSHEEFNSIELDYKTLTNDEIIDFINDEYPDEDNDIIINAITKLIDIPVNFEFSFKDIGISDELTKYNICQVCDKINLELISPQNKLGLMIATYDGFEEIDYTPALCCELDDKIIKRN